MGPPINHWPCSRPPQKKTNISDATESDINNNNNDKRLYRSDSLACNKCNVYNIMNRCRVLCVNFTVVLFVLQILARLTYATAGPVVVNMDYKHGPVPIARNIRHLPCISRRTFQEGLCMFAIDCVKVNGTHLGTCIDRFYFGSCCQIQDNTILPHEEVNNIDDNSIDGASFVHPQTENSIVSKPPYKVTSKKPTTVKVETTTVTEKLVTLKDHTDSMPLETKSDEQSILENKITNEEVKFTTVVAIETTTKTLASKSTTKGPESFTEEPLKLSTFQTVSGSVSDLVTEKPTSTATSDIRRTTTQQPAKETTITSTTTSPSAKPQSSRKPIKPTYKPRPTNRPTNYTRPQNAPSTNTRPKPTLPVSIYNTTRLPYRPPPKRPTSKKPLPIPPRLNITVIPNPTPKPTSSRLPVTSITYINSTSPVSIVTETTSPSPTTKLSTTQSTTTSTTQTTPVTTETTTTTVTTPIPALTQIMISSTTELVVERSTERPVSSSQEVPTSSSSTSQMDKDTTVTELVTENETLRPVMEDDITSSSATTVSSTEFPPLVTWSSTIDATTRAPENLTTLAEEETWSPITPPEGWVLMSTILPKPETTSATTTTTTQPTTTTTKVEDTPAQPETTPEAITTTQRVETLTTTLHPTSSTTLSTSTTTQSTSTTTQSTSTTTQSTSTTTQSTSTTTQSTSTTTVQPTTASIQKTETPILEFTVNVTLSPTVPTSTSSMGLTTFTSVTPGNDTNTSVANKFNETTNGTDVAKTTETVQTDKVTEAPTPEFNMSNYKEVCGRRLWNEARIVGGSKAAFGRWPWQISLRQYRTSTYLHKCGAALLNENWAITAAHCVEHVPPSELLIRLGEHDLANEDEPFPFAERRVQLVASHPHFDPATFEYDLALLRFFEPVSFQPNILPVCVPDNDENYVGKTAYVTGWGRLYDEGPLPSVLQEVEVPVINNTACEGMYQAAGYNEHIPHIFICAGWKQGGADSCEGDSGGPMVVQRERDGRFVLSGIISWGIGCAEPNQPGVYTRISEFRDWINQILQF